MTHKILWQNWSSKEASAATAGQWITEQFAQLTRLDSAVLTDATAAAVATLLQMYSRYSLLCGIISPLFKTEDVYFIDVVTCPGLAAREAGKAVSPPKCEGFSSPQMRVVYCRCSLCQCFLNFHVLVSHLEILLKCRFWFSKSKVRPEIPQHPSDTKPLVWGPHFEWQSSIAKIFKFSCILE